MSFLVLSAGCGGGATAVSEVRQYTYVSEPFSTVEECRAAADPIFNCEPSLILCPNGGYVLAVTDILNAGHYTLDGDHLVATLGSTGDTAPEFEAVLGSDGSLTSEEIGSDWRLKPLSEEERIRIEEQDCATLEGRDWW